MAKSADTVVSNSCTWEAYFADVGETFPTASASIAGNWVSVGYVDEDPTTELNLTSQSLKPSNACAPIRVTVTQKEIVWNFAQASFTKLTIENWFGAGTWATSGSGERLTLGALATVEKALIFATQDPVTDQVIRLLCERVAVAPSGAINWRTDGLVALPIACTTLAGDDGLPGLFVDANPALAAD